MCEIVSGTIADNLRYGDREADEKDLRRAIEIAQAGEFVDSLADGLDSRVAQGGTNFSGGQKQRLSIARALVGDRQLVIFARPRLLPASPNSRASRSSTATT